MSRGQRAGLDLSIRSGQTPSMKQEISQKSGIELKFVSGTLVLSGVGFATLETWFPQGLWVYDPRILASRCDACYYSLVTTELQSRSIPFIDSVSPFREVHWRLDEQTRLRPEQMDAVETWLQAHRRGCVIMPTGTGKTEVALAIMRQTRISTLVVAPVRDLMYQWHRRILNSLGYDAGIIGDSIYRVHPVSVTTYDSACIHMQRFGDQFGLIIFDECHHLPGNVRRDAALMSVAPCRLGLTATPERSDGRHLDLPFLIGPFVYELQISAVRGRSLADYDVVRIPVHLTDAEQKRYDLLSEQIRSFMQTKRDENPDVTWEDVCAESGTSQDSRRVLVAWHAKRAIEDRAEEKLRILEDLFRLYANERCIVFAGSNAMARDVSTRFLIPCLLNHCGKKERQDILEGFASGRYPAIVANQVLDEGVDVPAAKVAVVIGGMSSSRQARQRLGRILRRSGDARATLYEIVCSGTTEEDRSRKRRRHETFENTTHQRRSGREDS